MHGCKSGICGVFSIGCGCRAAVTTVALPLFWARRLYPRRRKGASQAEATLSCRFHRISIRLGCRWRYGAKPRERTNSREEMDYALSQPETDRGRYIPNKTALVEGSVFPVQHSEYGLLRLEITTPANDPRNQVIQLIQANFAVEMAEAIHNHFPLRGAEQAI